MIKSLKDKVLEKQKEVEQFNQKSIAFQSKVAEVKSQVQSCVDQIIAIIEARKQDVFDAVDNQATKSLESLSQKKKRSRKTETVLKRSLVLKSLDSVKHSIQSCRNSTTENRDTECILRFSVTRNS